MRKGTASYLKYKNMKTKAMEWEEFDFGSNSAFGSLNASAKRPSLAIGKRTLGETGFDPDIRYDVLFDRKHCALGLRPSSHGRRVHGNKGAYIRLSRAFVSRFELSGKYIVSKVDRGGDIWIFHLIPK